MKSVWDPLIPETEFGIWKFYSYRKTSNIVRTLVGNKFIDHSYVVGVAPTGAAPIVSSFPT